MKLFIIIIILSGFVSQSVFAEYILCTSEGQQTTISLNTSLMILSINEPLPIPGNDNAFKGVFQMTKTTVNTASTVLTGGLGSIQFCDGEKSTMVFAVQENEYKLSVYSQCPNSSAITYYESILSCTPH